MTLAGARVAEVEVAGAAGVGSTLDVAAGVVFAATAANITVAGQNGTSARTAQMSFSEEDIESRGGER